MNMQFAVKWKVFNNPGAVTHTWTANDWTLAHLMCARSPEASVNPYFYTAITADGNPLPSGEGAQKLDWDYRKELPDLQIGDSVSFVVEVADKYPGEGGAHRARTDSRRITFLSREEYLASVTKQMERLLTRVRTLYRQERAAHELVLALDPAADSYLQTC